MTSDRRDQRALDRFAGNLRSERLSAGLSQQQLADACGLHATEISRLERTRTDPRLSTVVEVARGLGCQPATLLLGLGTQMPAPDGS